MNSHFESAIGINFIGTSGDISPRINFNFVTRFVIVTEILNKLLHVTVTLIKDNFFDLGGHSLKATRVLSKIHEEFGIKIDLKNLFIDPTVEHLSNYIETMQWMESQNENV